MKHIKLFQDFKLKGLFSAISNIFIRGIKEKIEIGNSGRDFSAPAEDDHSGMQLKI
jgi:hypothetical protein